MVQRLSQAGLTQAAIQQQTGIPERTIRRIQQEDPVAIIDDGGFRKSRNIGRPSVVTEYEPVVRAWFKEPRRREDGPLSATEVLGRLRKLGYEGGKTAVFDLVRRLKPEPWAPPVVRFEGLPGEFSQHDFGQRRVTYDDGTTEIVHFFASRLKYSRLLDACIVPDEQLETVIRSLLRAFQTFGGVPLQCVFDNMKTVVISHRKGDDDTVSVQWNQVFGQFAVDCGFVPVACWPHRPQQKGSVENLVGFVKGNFFPGRRFRNRADLIRQLAEWQDEVNTRRPNDATGEIPSERLRHERLKTCAYTPSEYAFKASAIVRPTGRVVYNGIAYSVPAKYRGQTATLLLSERHVTIHVGNELVAEHDRFPPNGRSSVLPAHAEEMFTFQRGTPFAKRQLLLDLHPTVEPFLTELVHRRPRTWEHDVTTLYEVYQSVGHHRFLVALQDAWADHQIGAEYVRHRAEQAGGVHAGV